MTRSESSPRYAVLEYSSNSRAHLLDLLRKLAQNQSICPSSILCKTLRLARTAYPRRVSSGPLSPPQSKTSVFGQVASTSSNPTNFSELVEQSDLPVSLIYDQGREDDLATFDGSAGCLYLSRVIRRYTTSISA
ncbi:hypothetical protein RB195_019683 [Necator americanus]|uniref:Uncharacterized protein n=1 Tax=Necator americanus TaxID=51031 RepID=A0ABR1CFA4_NECAM